MKFITPISWHRQDKQQHEKDEKELRQKLINNFVNKNRNKFDEIKDALNTGDIKKAHRLVHTLKGNAAQLEKTPLQHIASEVEYALMDGENHAVPQQLDKLNYELNVAIAELEPLVSEILHPTEAEGLDNAEARKLLDELEPYVKEGDPECLILVDRLRQIQGSGELIRQLEEFEFRAAMETLTELKKLLPNKI